MIQFGDSRLPERFWSKVQTEPNSGCWLWIASLNNKGYGQFNKRRTVVGRYEWSRRSEALQETMLAHRHAYQVLVSNSVAGLDLDHLCRTRSCVNPAHLEPVDHAENSRRGVCGEVNAARMLARTHCKRGLSFAEHSRMRGGVRVCLPCKRLRSKAAKERMAELRRHGGNAEVTP